MKKTLLTAALFFVLLSTLCFSATAVENVTFDTVEGDSAAIYSENKEITVNVFGRTTCGNTIGTLRNILSAEIDKADSVQVNFIDIDRNDRYTVLNFKNGDNFDDFSDNRISYAYSSNGLANSLMWDIIRSVDSGATNASLPVIAYIDQNGRLITYSMGIKSGSNILKIINNKDTINEKATFTVEGYENYDYAYEVLAQLNSLRASKGLSALTMDKELLEAAMQRAAECGIYYSHTRPDGSSCFSIFNKNGYMAENIAIGQASPTQVMNAWTNSSGHYKNMTGANYKSVGIGVFETSHGTLCWVQYFYSGNGNDPATKGVKETKRTVTATVENLDISCYFYGDTLPEILKTGDTTGIAIINNNTQFNTKQSLSFSEFTAKSKNENLIKTDGAGNITVTGKPPFTAYLTISNKSNPKASVDVPLEIGHEHSYYAAFEEKTYSSGEEKIITTYRCFYTGCYDSYKEEKTSKHEHSFIKQSNTTSSGCGFSKIENTYTCSLCKYSYTEETTTGSHDFSDTQIIPATKASDGAVKVCCSGCSEVKGSTPIPRISDIAISETEYICNGKEKNPVITIKNSTGTALKEGTDYYISKDNLTSSGIKDITVYFKGKYSGNQTFKIYIYPASPSGLTLKSTAKTVTAKWKNAKGADSYKVELLRNGKSYKTVTASATTVKFEKLSKNTKYTVRVTALSAYDSLSSLKSISSDTATVSAPVLKVKAQKKKASLSWDKVKNASGYVIYMATAKNEKYKKVATVKGGTLKYTKKKLKTNKKYYFKIKTYRTIGKKNIYSSYSSVKSVKIK